MRRNSARIRHLSACLAVLGLAAFSSLSATESEDELRSATVLTFVRHAEWRQSPAGPITIAVAGRPDMVRTLRRTLEGKTANGRAIRVVDAKPTTELHSCQVLYIASDNNSQIRETLAAWRVHALTIGESDRFLENGGAVNLLIVNGHMSFEVSLEALDRAGVGISSTLLRYGQVAPVAPHSARPPA